MLSNREELLLWGGLLLCIFLLERWRSHHPVRAKHIAGMRIRGERIPVTRINVIRYSIGSRLLWFSGLLVCMTAFMFLTWRTGSMSAAALIASVIVIFFVLILFNLPMFMTLMSIRPALKADRFSDELRGHCFKIDGDELTCVTKNWYVVLCGTASFVLHAPDIDFEKAAVRSDRSVRTNGKIPYAFLSGGTRVFLKSGKTVFVPGTMTPQLKGWLNSHKHSA